MSEFPRTQKIAALAIITSVVLVTLLVVALRGGMGADAVQAQPDPNATPTAVPVLQRDRLDWSAVSAELRGAQGTEPPVPCSIVDERSKETNNFLSITPGLTFVCEQAGMQARPIAPGRVVMAVNQPPLNSTKADLVADGADGPWIRASAYGRFVVVDHGTVNDVANVTTIYAGLNAIDDNLRLGQLVDTSTPLGLLGDRFINGERVNGVMTFEYLADDIRFGTEPVRQEPVAVTETPALADMVADVMGIPVDTCTVPFGNPNLVVGALREYRSGIHNGLDFNCSTNDHVVKSAAEGQILFVVDGYVDATTEDRDAVLAQTVDAFDTPFWTLAMLYGNFVVVDHRLPDGNRAITIYAHLSEINEGIVTGTRVDATTPLGFVGNSGTSAAADGITNNHGSVHLHWELHVNDRPIGYLERPEDTDPLYQNILCTPVVAGGEPTC